LFIKKVLLSIIFVFVFASSIFSEHCIHFENITHDFEDIKEEDGTVECDFIFYNSGDEPLKLKKVKAG